MNTSMHTFSHLTLMAGLALGGTSPHAVVQAPGTPPASAGWQPATVKHSDCAAAPVAIAPVGEVGGHEAASVYGAADALPEYHDDRAYTAVPEQFPPAPEGLHRGLPAAIRLELFQVPSAATYVDVGRHIGEREVDLVQGYAVPLPASIAPEAELADTPATDLLDTPIPEPVEPRKSGAGDPEAAAVRVDVTPPRR